MYNWVSYYLPILVWLPAYSPSKDALHDLIAGVTLGMILIPNGIAYATLAQVPPVYGLLTCVLPPLVYSILGSSRQLSIGPEAMSAILTGHFGRQIASSMKKPESVLVVATSISFLAGALLLLLGFLRLGFLESVLSKPVLAGFVIAVGIAIIASQLTTAFGLQPCVDCPDTAVSEIGWWLSQLDQLHVPTTLIFAVSLLILQTLHTLKRRYKYQWFWRLLSPVPAVVVLLTLCSWLFDWEHVHSIHTLGLVPATFPAPRPPQLTVKIIQQALMPSAVIAIVLYLESLVVGKTYAGKYNYVLSPNRELVAFGAANLVCSLFHCIPCGGSFVRSKVGDLTGARTQLAGLLSGMFCLVVVLVALPTLQFLPYPGIAAVVTYSAIHLLEHPVHQLLFFHRIRAWGDLLLLLVMIVATTLLGANNSIFFAFTACLFMLIKKTNQPTIGQLGLLRQSDPHRDRQSSQRRLGNKYGLVDMNVLKSNARPLEHLLALRFTGKLHFANAARLRDLLWRVESFGDFTLKKHLRSDQQQSGRPRPRAILLDMTGALLFRAHSLYLYQLLYLPLSLSLSLSLCVFLSLFSVCLHARKLRYIWHTKQRCLPSMPQRWRLCTKF